MKIVYLSLLAFLIPVSLIPAPPKKPATAHATLARGYYVATNGNDSWSGLRPSPNSANTDGPFLTLPRAQTAMQGSSIKTVYIRAGIYYPEASGEATVISLSDAQASMRANAKTAYIRGGAHSPASSAGSGCFFGGLAAINLVAADSGETWSYYPPDGYNTAILDGGASSPAHNGTTDTIPLGNGVLDCAFSANESLSVTINGLQFRNWNYGALYVNSNATSAAIAATFTNNIVHNTYIGGFGGAAVLLSCASGSNISNNYIYDTNYIGIQSGRSGGSPCDLNNITISNNVLLNTCMWITTGGNEPSGGDCGAIYTGNTGSGGTAHRIVNNYIRDVNRGSNGAGNFGFCCATGIYLDDGSIGLTVSGNVVTGTHSQCFSMGQQNNTVTGNICDLGADTATMYQLIFAVPVVVGTGTIYQNNINVIPSIGMYPYGYRNNDGNPTAISVTNNTYWNYSGGSVFNKTQGGGGVGNDTNPITENPQLSCWAVTVANTSPALAFPVNFSGIKGGWGPPGFTIPQTGTPPSWPHGC